MDVYAFWNNKGGTGKTSLAFQTICRYAEQNANERVLAIDVCPQANMSELFLGGLTNKGSAKLLQRQGLVPRCTIGGYFQLRLPSPFAVPGFSAEDFITNPEEFNRLIPSNIDLLCGDPLLELQSNAINLDFASSVFARDSQGRRFKPNPLFQKWCYAELRWWHAAG